MVVVVVVVVVLEVLEVLLVLVLVLLVLALATAWSWLAGHSCPRHGSCGGRALVRGLCSRHFALSSHKPTPAALPSVDTLDCLAAPWTASPARPPSLCASRSLCSSRPARCLRQPAHTLRTQ